MSRIHGSHSNEDDLMQIALYMIPRYMKRIKKYNKRYIEDDLEEDGHEHEHGDEPFIDEKKLIDFLKDNLMDKKGMEHDNKKNGPQDNDLIKKGKEKAENIIDKAIDADIKEEKSNSGKADKSSKVSKPTKPSEPTKPTKVDKGENKDNDTKIENKHYYISNFLANFSGKSVEVGLKYSAINCLDNVSLIYADESLIKIQNVSKKTFVVPIKNIAGIYLKDYSTKNQIVKAETDNKPVKKTMGDYLKSIISDKKISIETTSNGRFKSIKEVFVKKAYDNFIMLDNGLIISIDSIVLIEELYNEN